MLSRRVSFSLMYATVAMVTLLGVLGWHRAQASSLPVAQTSALQATMPMTGTQHSGHTMPAGAPMQPGAVMTGAEHAGQIMPEVNTDPHAGHSMPEAGATVAASQPTATGGMGQMMAQMAEMQGMMARMQRMMAGHMMTSGAPMSGTMPIAGMMQGDMGEMMDMMAEMQGMMAEIQGMMAGEMDKSMGAAGMSGMGQMQGQQMGGGMMNQMPMMGTMIMVMPMPMMQGGMMQGMNMGGMMGGQGGMMGGQGGMMQGATDAAATPASATGAAQSGKLGEIEIKVTPPDLTNIQGETIDFTIDLNATGADLSFDLAPLATLRIGDHEMPATTWEVAYDHGHHVNGVLKFPAHMQGAVESATLTFTSPTGEGELTLTWPPAE